MRSPIAVTRALLGRVVPSGAILLSVLTFGSYLMGLVRDRILTGTFGAEAALDTFNAAFVIPELTFGVIVASGLAAPFIPIFAALKRDEGLPAAHAFGQTVLTAAVLLMGIVAVVLFIVAPWTVELVAPSFGPEQRELYTELFRVMCITQILFAGSMALGEVLIAERRFFFYGAAPLLYNLGIVLGTVFLADAIGIFGPAIGAVLGATLHLGIRVAGIARTPFRIRPRLAVGTRAFREFLRLLLPKTGSSPIEPLSFLFFTRLASGLAVGSIVTINLARNFQSVPVSLIGVAFSLAAFPPLAAAYAASDRRGFTRLIATNTLTIGVLTTAAAIALAVVGPRAIGVLLGGGRFDADDVARTAQVLAVFAISVPFESLGHLLSRAIYATHHTLWQVGASLVGFLVTILVAQGFVGSLGVLAIPTAFAVGSAVRCALLVVVLAARVRRMRPAIAGPQAAEAAAGPADA
ncbi:MAG: putative peptidoglycan lipid flippase [Chloroflexota bacterium]|nr:putative peptidoglycan lipid flippase [Chloroflexota bacterium]